MKIGEICQKILLIYQIIYATKIYSSCIWSGCGSVEKFNLNYIYIVWRMNAKSTHLFDSAFKADLET